MDADSPETNMKDSPSKTIGGGFPNPDMPRTRPISPKTLGYEKNT